MGSLCVPAEWAWPRREAEMYRMAGAGVPWARRTFPAFPAAMDPAEWALRVAQSARYVPDPAWCPTDYYQPPDVTWRDGGDCDDLVILCLTLAMLRGVPARVERLLLPHANQDHVLVCAWSGGAWKPGDPSIPNARLGETSAVAARRLGLVVPVGPAPLRATGLAPLAAAGAAAVATSAALPVAELGFPLIEFGIAAAVGLGVFLLAEERRLVPRANPFAGYADFAACEASARGRRRIRDPAAYCGAIMRRAEGAAGTR